MRIAATLRGDCSSRQEAWQDGFSLVEMMVTVGIMAIILAVALPAFSAWRESNALQSAEETLIAHLKQARIMAVSENRSVSVVFTNNGYTVDSGGANQQQYLLRQYSKNLTMTYTASTLTFGSGGTSNTETVNIKNANGATRTISVNIVGRAYD